MLWNNEKCIRIAEIGNASVGSGRRLVAEAGLTDNMIFKRESEVGVEIHYLADIKAEAQ